MSNTDQLGQVSDCGTVLIADDEDMMREVMRMMVADNGGHALTAVDGLDALTVFKQNIEKIDVAVLDYSMPHMDGYAAFVEMRKIKPSLGVCFVSGLKQTAEIAQLAKQKDIGFLPKPFKEDDFVAEVRNAYSRSKK